MKTLLKKITLSSLILISITSCEDCCPDGEPTGKITETTAATMHNLYLTTFSEAIDQAAGIEQPKQINFDILELEKYICKVKDSAAVLGYNGTLGLSVYFGAKTNEGGETELTVFFSPTNKIGATTCNITGITRLNYGSAWQPPGLSVICEPTN